MEYQLLTLAFSGPEVALAEAVCWILEVSALLERLRGSKLLSDSLASGAMLPRLGSERTRVSWPLLSFTEQPSWYCKEGRRVWSEEGSTKIKEGK